MIKELKNITDNDLSYMRNHQITVTEKLDLISFKVVISKDKVIVYNTKRKPISVIDYIVNSVNREIVDFVNENIKTKRDEIYAWFGDCECNFFYKPVSKTRVIDYVNLDDEFILGNLYTSDKSLKNVEKFASIIGVRYLSPICVKDGLCEFDDINNGIDIINKLTNGKTWSGNDVCDIEGVIISCGKLTYKITVNSTFVDIEKTTKKLYRDTILENFCNVVLSSESAKMILDSNKSYIEKVCELFLEYINSTNIFTKMCIESEDILPPNAGYIGDIDYTFLSPTTKIICKNNEVYKNILRILLITFDKDNLGDKYKGFSDDVKSKLTYISKKIKTSSKN